MQHLCYHQLAIFNKEHSKECCGERPHSGSSPSSYASTHTATENPAEVASAGQQRQFELVMRLGQSRIYSKYVTFSMRPPLCSVRLLGQ
jgi:hypothetical protein